MISLDQIIAHTTKNIVELPASHDIWAPYKAKQDPPGGSYVNGWRRGPEYAGRRGPAGKYMEKGIANFKGIIGNDPAEAKYFQVRKDKNGEFLNGGRDAYELTFPSGETPPADAFWSITMYDKTANLVDNSLDRY